MHTVKQVSEKIGTTTETIRYYTRLGIIMPERDPINGYRYYSDRDIYLVRFVRKAKTYGLTIQEIRKIIEKSHRGESPCPLVKEMVTSRYRETREKIRELRTLESRLALALMEWGTIDISTPTEDMICPLIEKELADN